MKCEICLQSKFSDLKTAYSTPKFLICNNCKAIYFKNRQFKGIKHQSIPAHIIINNFRGYDNRYLDSLIHGFICENIGIRSKLLDIGCYDGRLIHFTNQLDFDSYGVELQPEMVEFCRKNNLKVYHGIFPHAMPKELIEQKYDVITSFESIYYWDSFDKCVGMIYELLNNKGYFLVKLNQGTSILYNRKHPINERTGDFSVMLNKRALEILFGRHGFKLVSYKAFAYCWDGQRYIDYSKVRKLIVNTWFKIKSILTKYFCAPEEWDKILLLFQKKDFIDT
jgi:SAM-dependent methyltransferase